jgi:hypothetical protein
MQFGVRDMKKGTREKGKVRKKAEKQIENGRIYQIIRKKGGNRCVSGE